MQLPFRPQAVSIRSSAVRTWCFNPHPAFWPDAIPAFRPMSSVGPRRPLKVSILIRPSEGRMQPRSATSGRNCQSLLVSILIRPEGRMQPWPRCGLYGRRRCFNPHPALAGCNLGRSGQPRSLGGQRFNPHPARRPDATLLVPRSRRLQGLSAAMYVSILIRPEGRMQRGGSIPAQAAIFYSFQSSSGQTAGCNCRIAAHSGRLLTTVSILIRPEGRMQPTSRPTYWRRHHRFGVSILIRPEGRMQRPPEIAG